MTNTYSRIINIFFVITFLVAGVCGVKAENKTNNRTPLALSPGSPVGSYNLSGFEIVNLFNGNLSFNLPLLNVGGRGEAKYTMMLNVEHKWSVNHNNEFGTHTPTPSWWTTLKSGYGPGVLQARQTMTGCDTPGTYTETRTNLTFTTPDGTEIELKDTIAYGAPQSSVCQYNYPANGAPRGSTFVSKDSSFLTFISDSPIYDLLSSNVTMPYLLLPSGFLMTKDGLSYRIDEGTVTSMRDRHGNTISFTYTGEYIDKKVATITDSLNRQINVEYNISDGLYGLCDRITFKGISGENRIIRISKSNLASSLKIGQTIRTFHQLFPELADGIVDAPYNPNNIVTSVWLPDGRKYGIFYNSYQDIARIELPTGGAIEYDWWGTDNYNQFYEIYRRVVERRSYHNGTALEGKTTYSVPMPGTNSVTVEQFSANNTKLSVQKHYFYGNAFSLLLLPDSATGWMDGREYKTEEYTANDTTLLRETNQVWYQDTSSWGGSGPTAPPNNPKVIENTVRLAETNQISKQTFSYDQYNNQTDVYEYDYGVGAPGAFKRRTHTDYVTDANYLNNYLRSLPSQTWVSSDINGDNKVSQTEFKYDETPLEPRSNVIGWQNPNTIYRGNVTKVRNWLKYGTAPETWLETTSKYDVLGNVIEITDPKSNTTTIDYTDRFGAPNDEARSNTAPAQLNGQSTFAFPTSGTNSLGWIIGFTQYDYFTGQPVNAEDLNEIISKTFYNDPLDRPTQTVTAVGTTFERQSTVIYDDANRRIETKADLNALNDNLLKSESFYDGLGRTVETRKYEADGGYVAAKTIPFAVVQDPETNIWRAATQASNPYRPLAGEQPVWTTSLSDSLGRTVKTITPDGAIVKTEYSGNAVTVTDQAGKQRRSITNALGQLTRVDEPDNNGNLGTIAVPVQPTDYRYNTIGKMVEVTQGVQKRHFLYDSLGRLIRVRQPEQQVNTALNLSGSETANTQWTAAFSYDNNGNTLTATDAKNVTTTSSYDALNRPLTRSYSDGVTAAVNYTYDAVSVPNSKGKLTKVSSTISETSYTSYDIMGRLMSSEQATDGRTFQSSYKYNLAGMLIEQTYPSGRTVKNFLEADGDLAAISSKAWNGQSKMHAANFSYTATGVIKHLQLGNGLWESAKLNSRDQVTELNMGVSPTDGSKWQLKYDYGEFDANGNVDPTKNSGNIARQTISMTGLAQPFVQTYKYDALDRITEAKETNNGNQTWIQTFGYDRYGNRTAFSQNVLGQQLPINNLTLPTVDQNTNRFQTGQGYNYDAVGNLIADATGKQFTFDGDNKQTEVKNAANIVVGKYYYDGNGKRVKKVTDSEFVIFVYDGMGKLAAEYSTTPPSNPTTNYTATDPLGSPRVITNKQGEIVSRRDFMPFGEQLAPDATYRTANLKYNNADNIRQKFTGYQRDDETGLDFAEARYYNNFHGRFTAVDPLLASGKSSDPQTFNRYVYTMNRPLILTDSTGLQAGGRAGSVGDKMITAIFIAKNPVDAYNIGRGKRRGDITGSAIGFSSRSGLSNDLTGINGEKVYEYGNQVNAVRHAAWQAIITKEIDSETAEEIGIAHEPTAYVNTNNRFFTGSANNLEKADEIADLLNNKIGRQIGSDNPNASRKDLALKVLEHFKEKGLFTVHINKNGSTQVVQTKITEEDYKRAVRIINSLNDYAETEEEAKKNEDK